MKAVYMWLCSMGIIFSLNAQTTVNNLMPIPAQIEQKDGKYRISDSFSVTVTGNSHPRINKAVSRMVARLGGRTGFFLPQLFFDKDKPVENADMIITIKQPGKVELGEDEANTQIQAYMIENSLKDKHELQSYFNNRLLRIITKYDKEMVGWDEILLPN